MDTVPGAVTRQVRTLTLLRAEEKSGRLEYELDVKDSGLTCLLGCQTGNQPHDTAFSVKGSASIDTPNIAVSDLIFLKYHRFRRNVVWDSSSSNWKSDSLVKSDGTISIKSEDRWIGPRQGRVLIAYYERDVGLRRMQSSNGIAGLHGTTLFNLIRFSPAPASP